MRRCCMLRGAAGVDSSRPQAQRWRDGRQAAGGKPASPPPPAGCPRCRPPSAGPAQSRQTCPAEGRVEESVLRERSTGLRGGSDFRGGARCCVRPPHARSQAAPFCSHLEVGGRRHWHRILRQLGGIVQRRPVCVVGCGVQRPARLVSRGRQGRAGRQAQPSTQTAGTPCRRQAALPRAYLRPPPAARPRPGPCAALQSPQTSRGTRARLHETEGDEGGRQHV